ncbi:cache domain-containing protein [Roseovarius sp. M141]|uniref:cache domain-containing protein n=1 Tax=Roseovarius sp. M141 TaxID=2583806 RepID=UPI0020CDDE95|nr:cache domain-containing protein [Roseovarius sp. M141]MCQ0092016.1 PAS domain S-box protein [Roseovarius sp. M141]
MKTSLGLVLALCLAGLQFLAIIVVVSSSYLSSERVLLDHARSLLRDVGINTIVHSQGFLDPAQGAAELAARLAENRIVASENRQLLEKLLFQQLQIAPQLAGLYFGDREGNFVYVMRSEEIAPFRSKIVTRNADGHRTEFVWRADDFTIVDSRTDPNDTFDPRERPWYQEAKQQNGMIWTDPYIFFSSQMPGITIAAPVVGTSGQVQGVIGVDIEISAISDFLSTLKIGENGTALIVNKNGDVIAHPKPELLKAANPDGTFRLPGIDEVDDAIAREAFGNPSKMEFVPVDTETYAEFTYEGADFVSTIMPIMSAELPWTIAVYAPKMDFIGTIIENRTRDIWIAVLVAILTGVVGLMLANYITKPVRAFAVRAALISQGEIAPSAPSPKTYKELERANETLVSEILQRKKSEREYGQTFNLSSRGMVQISPDTGQFTRANAKFSDIVGYSINEILQMTEADLSHPGDPMVFPNFTSDNLENGGSSIEKRCIRKDGETIWIKVNAIMIRDNDGKPLHAVATIDDVTQSKITEAQINKLNRDLSHLARGELLGRMAAGLAHELNQPLTAITQNADAAILTATSGSEHKGELVRILNDLDQQAHRAADIVKALRGFARKGEEWKAPFDLTELIGQTLLLVLPEATEHDVRISVAADDLPQVYGIRVQVAQVIVNLLRNAIEAIISSGVNKKTINVSASVEGDFVKVCIEDSGPGVDPQLGLFAQFETTKNTGMGLGLSICRSIIEAGGGRIWYEASDDLGARFQFTIPTTA